MGYRSFQSEVSPTIREWTKEHPVDRRKWFVGLHPFLMFRLFGQTAMFKRNELLGLLFRMKDIDLAFKSGGANPVVCLEQLLISTTRKRSTARR